MCLEASSIDGDAEAEEFLSILTGITEGLLKAMSEVSCNRKRENLENVLLEKHNLGRFKDNVISYDAENERLIRERDYWVERLLELNKV